MKTNFYLKVNNKGKVTASRNAPYLTKDGVSIYVGMVLPDVLFKRPQISATITVDQKNVTPFVINAETLNSVRDATQQSTEMEVKLTIEQPLNDK